MFQIFYKNIINLYPKLSKYYKIKFSTYIFEEKQIEDIINLKLHVRSQSAHIIWYIIYNNIMDNITTQ